MTNWKDEPEAKTKKTRDRVLLDAGTRSSVGNAGEMPGDVKGVLVAMAKQSLARLEKSKRKRKTKGLKGLFGGGE